MSDETVEQHVVQDTTEAEREVIEQMSVASLEQLKSLPVMRKASAVPFEIPGTGLVVKIAPCTATEAFTASVHQLRAIASESDEERFSIRQIMARSLVKSCVVEPELDDEALDAIDNYDVRGLTALLQKCHEVSGMDDVMVTDQAESFS